jgi:hypothetical protein
MTSERSIYTGAERRNNPRLRELIDEMLASIRAAHRVDLWTDEERLQYQEQLSRILDSVRTEALVVAKPAGRAKLG